MNSEILDKIEQILDSTISEECFRSILIDHLGDNFKFDNENIILLDKNLQNILNFTNEICYFIDENIGGKIFINEDIYYDGLNIIFLTNGINKIGPTKLIYLTTYQGRAQEYFFAIKEVMNHSLLSYMEIFDILSVYGIENEIIDDIKNELEVIFNTEIKNDLLIKNHNDKFINLKDDDCKSVLQKIQTQIEPKVFIYQLYQNDFIKFEEYIRVQNFLKNSDDLKDININLTQNAVLALNCFDGDVKFVKNDKFGYILTLLFKQENETFIDFTAICKAINIKEPYKYAITQILLNSTLSPNEILRNCADIAKLTCDEKEIFELAISFCRVQNLYFLGKDYVCDKIQILDDKIALKSSFYGLNDIALSVFDRRFFEIIDDIKKDEIINKLAIKNTVYRQLGAKDENLFIDGLAMICKQFLQFNAIQSDKCIQ